MSESAFEFEERYRVMDPQAAQATLQAAGFTKVSSEAQTDHWFIPKSIMSTAEQNHWFDHEAGHALRIREAVSPSGETEVLITAKQLLRPADHSAMSNTERPLTVAGAQYVLGTLGNECSDIVAALRLRSDQTAPIPFEEAKEFIERAGRKEYITLGKHRTTFRNAVYQNIVVDLDVVPALAATTLGFSASIELEYKGTASLAGAKESVREVRTALGYKQSDMISMALPGLAIPYLAKF